MNNDYIRRIDALGQPATEQHALACLPLWVLQKRGLYFTTWAPLNVREDTRHRSLYRAVAWAFGLQAVLDWGGNGVMARIPGDGTHRFTGAMFDVWDADGPIWLTEDKEPWGKEAVYTRYR